MGLNVGLGKLSTSRAESGRFLNDLTYGSGKDIEFNNINEYIIPSLVLLLLGIYLLRKK